MALAAVCAGCSPAPQSGASHAPGPATAAERATAYADAVEDANAAVRTAESASRHEALALALLDRAQLTGSFDDYVAADRVLQQAWPSGDAPCLAAARVHIVLHRLNRAAAAAAACEAGFGQTAAERAELAGISADVAFYQGRYDEALRGYRAALALDESLGGLARLSQYHARTGAPAEAAALLDRAERIYHGASARPLAWLALQRGVLSFEQGRHDEALAHYLQAQRRMPGWWRVEEHIAEVRALRGERDLALQAYESLVQRTGLPELMDAMAKVLLEQGQGARAAEWIGRAREVHRRHVLELPEAAAGHAVEHFLRFEPLEANELLALAQRDVAARPGAEARIRLARAFLRLGRSTDAAAALRPVLGSPWKSPQLHAVASQLPRAGDS